MDRGNGQIVIVTYDSARFPLALLLAFETTSNTDYRDAGISVMNFLSKTNFPNEGMRLHIIGNRVGLSKACHRGSPI